MNKRIYSIAAGLLALLAFASCHDGDDFEPTLNGGWGISVDDESLVIDRYRRYNNFTVTQNGEQDTALVVTADADWLTLTTDTLPQDGIVDFLAEENDGTKSRTANITLRSADNPEHTATISVRQKGMGDYDDNSDKESDYAVGWGFNAYDEFKNSASVKGKIIDDAKLQAFDSDTTFNSIQGSMRGQSSFDIYTAYSLQEMSSTLTKTTEETSGFLFYKKTIKRYEKICTNKASEQLYGYARLTKVVAQRSIDQGALEYILNDENIIKSKRQPFTTEFREIFNDITGSSGTWQDSLIKTMLNRFGTHIIINASVGGAIDYMVTFSRSAASSFEQSCKEQCSRMFGRSSSSSDEKIAQSATSSVNNSNAIQISGGSEATRSALAKSIEGMTQADQLDSKKLADWDASISSSCLDNATSRKNLDIVDFLFIPIWKVFPTAELQNKVTSLVLEMGENSNTCFSDKELGVDNYSIDLTRSDFGSFGNTNSSTLVKVVYYNNVPIVEICNEYVPQIRGDQRITVFYPIYNGRTRIGQGLFPGDGEGNPPAYLTFSDGSVYVNPIDGYGYNDKITTAYYLHGNIYDRDYGTALKKNNEIKVSEHYLQFNGSNTKYPIVKIGSGYWTRCNIKENMQFGTKNRGIFKVHEKIIDGILFAEIFDTNKGTFLTNNSDMYGKSIDSISGKRTKWYLPVTEDRMNLTAYLGNNLKAMFKGQAAGFNAEFAGYWGHYDITTGQDLDAYDRRDKDTYCYLAFKQDIDSNKGDALLLTTDYTWKHASIMSANNNYYPVRLFRTNYFTYK